jgi:type IX secretion system PorP/SprF family membrane protein
MTHFKKMTLAVLLMLIATVTFAQQDAQYSMYMFNGMAINPAYAGSRERPAITALYRHQWTGIAGAPKTFTLSGHSPLLNDRIGVGGAITSDNAIGCYAV